MGSKDKSDGSCTRELAEHPGVARTAKRPATPGYTRPGHWHGRGGDIGQQGRGGGTSDVLRTRGTRRTFAPLALRAREGGCSDAVQGGRASRRAATSPIYLSPSNLGTIIDALRLAR